MVSWVHPDEERAGRFRSGRPSSFVPKNATRNQCPRAGLGKITSRDDSHVRLVLAALCISAHASMACAQPQLNLDRLSASQPISGGATASPDDAKGQSQPRGPTGPLSTGSGGTTAASPRAVLRQTCRPCPKVQRLAQIRSSARRAPSVRRQVRIEKDGPPVHAGGLAKA